MNKQKTQRINKNLLRKLHILKNRIIKKELEIVFNIILTLKNDHIKKRDNLLKVLNELFKLLDKLNIQSFLQRRLIIHQQLKNKFHPIILHKKPHVLFVLQQHQQPIKNHAVLDFDINLQE